jgi:hypothetical protein
MSQDKFPWRFLRSEKQILIMRCTYSQTWPQTQRVTLRPVNSKILCEQTKFDIEIVDPKLRDMIKVDDIFEVLITKKNPTEVSDEKV